MASGPETRMAQKATKALRQRGAYVFNVHGDPRQTKGTPDRLVCYRGFFIGMEFKHPDARNPHPTDMQRHQLRLIDRAGGWAVVVRSVEGAMEALDMVDQGYLGNLPDQDI